jgi:hypothetical protein
MPPLMPLVISTKSRIVRLRGHVTYTGDRKGPYRALVGNLRATDHLSYLNVNGKMLKWVFNK